MLCIKRASVECWFLVRCVLCLYCVPFQGEQDKRIQTLLSDLEAKEMSLERMRADKEQLVMLQEMQDDRIQNLLKDVENNKQMLARISKEQESMSIHLFWNSIGS